MIEFCKLNSSAMSNKLLVQGNELTIAHFESTQHERNIMYAIMGQIKSDDPPTALYEINVSDISKHTGRRLRNDDFKNAIERLRNRDCIIKLSNGELRSKFISSAFFDDRGFVTIAIDSRLRPYLFELKKNFTTFGLSTAIALNSIYSKRLYEMLCQFRSTGILRIGLKELKERFCLINEDGTEKFERWVSFESKVLLMAKTEINEKADFTIEYELKKSNRKVVGIDFTITKKDNSEQKPEPIVIKEEKQESKDPRFDRTVERLTNYGMSSQQVNSIIKSNQIDRIVKVLYDIDCNKEKIANTSAFLVKIFNL